MHAALPSPYLIAPAWDVSDFSWSAFSLIFAGSLIAYGLHLTKYVVNLCQNNIEDVIPRCLVFWRSFPVSQYRLPLFTDIDAADVP